MPSKRTPRHRDRRPKVTPECLAVWRQLREIERHGARSDEYGDLGKRLAILCGLDWCTMQWPSTATSATLPSYLLHRPEQAAAWREARTARLALLAAEAAAK
jgi:hypothetical protein